MKKRGQIGIFILIGIVLLFVLVLSFLLINGQLISLTPVDASKQLEVGMSNVMKEINECVDKHSSEVIQTLGKNGGFFEPVSVIVSHDISYNILCQNIPGEEGCLQTPLIKEEMNEKISNYLEGKLVDCIDIDKFKGKGYDLDEGELNVVTSVEKKSVKIIVNYPITLTKEEMTKSQDTFIRVVNVPLGDAIDVVNKILDYESLGVPFDPLAYSVIYLGTYEIEVDKPYPNTLYDVGFKDSEFKIKFAIEGESRFEE
jgi:hypothetical protein